MRDFLEDIGDRPDPIASARAAQRVPLPKRFYKSVSVGEAEAGYGVLLDGRSVRTPARAVLAVASRALAEDLAAEWEAQEREINPHAMPLTRLVNVALDGVARDPEAARVEILGYAGSDLLCYRAEGPERLVERQGAAWDPILARFRDDVGARFFLSAGIRHVAQPAETLARVAELIPTDPLQLAGMVSMTGLTGSALLSIAVAQGWISPEAAWSAAHVDEDWNRDLWGEDEEATARRAARAMEMMAAARLFAREAPPV
ncbi:MAG: ATPase [Rhizobiales bacterium 32-66-8]|nr:MAG: ATPase [Rhizobiales bacterium 32-66-8]